MDLLVCLHCRAGRKLGESLLLVVVEDEDGLDHGWVGLSRWVLVARARAGV
jgi:hypothetical protein